jgi:hypothetical protein
MKSLLISILSLALGGCIALPIAHDERLTPTMHGIVRDAVTGAPISGARVQMTDTPYEGSAEPVRSSEVQSADDGSYSVDVREHKAWFVLFLLGDFFGKCDGLLTVTKTGYATYTETPTGYGDPYVDGNECSTLAIRRDISLQPAPAP